MKKNILFDLDGTLIDSTEAILKSFDESFKYFKLKKVEHDFLKALIGYSLEDIFLKSAVDTKIIKDIVRLYKKEYKKIFLQSTTLLPGAKEAIKEAASFADICVVTTKGRENSQLILEKLKVLKYFKFVIGREDVSKPKPDPEGIELALFKLKANKNSSFMIGDTALDIKAAKSAGIHPIGLSCGYDLDIHKQEVNIFFDANKAVFYIKSLNI